MEFLQPRGRKPCQSSLDQRCSIQAGAQGQQIAGILSVQGHPAQQALDILYAFQRMAQLLPGDELFDSGFHRVQALVYLRDMNGRPQQPRAQQPLAHGSEGRVQSAEESDLVAGIGKQRLSQLQVADGDRIQNQALLAVIKADAVNMLKSAALGGANIAKT